MRTKRRDWDVFHPIDFRIMGMKNLNMHSMGFCGIDCRQKTYPTAYDGAVAHISMSPEAKRLNPYIPPEIKGS